MATRKSTTKGAARAFTQHNHTPDALRHAPVSAPERHIETLGEFSDAIDMVKTACAAFQTDERTTFGVTVLQLALEILQKVYNEIDHETPRSRAAPSSRGNIAKALAAPHHLSARLDGVFGPTRDRDIARSRRLYRLFDDLSVRPATRAKRRSGRQARRRGRVR